MDTLSLSELRHSLRVNNPAQLIAMRPERVRYCDQTHRLLHKLNNGQFYPVTTVLAREIDPEPQFSVAKPFLDDYSVVHYKVFGQMITPDGIIDTNHVASNFSVGSEGPLCIEGALFKSVHHRDRVIHFFSIDGLQTFRVPIDLHEQVTILFHNVAVDLLEVYV